MSYIVIQDWMRKELDLKGNDLLVYAIIYGFSQDGESKYVGSVSYLAKWCGSTKQGIRKNLDNLLSAGLIKKSEIMKNGIKFCEYSCQVDNSVDRGRQLSCPNNINNKIDNKRISISTSNDIDIDKKAPKKGTYGSYENVRLTDEEYEKFSAECPQAETYIERLSEYIAMKNPAYKSHLAVLRNWYRRDSEKGTVQGKEKVDPFMEELARLYEEGLD